MFASLRTIIFQRYALIFLDWLPVTVDLALLSDEQTTSINYV